MSDVDRGLQSEEGNNDQLQTSIEAMADMRRISTAAVQVSGIELNARKFQ